MTQRAYTLPIPPKGARDINIILLDTRSIDRGDPKYLRYLSFPRRERLSAMGSELARAEGFGAELALSLAVMREDPGALIPFNYTRTDRDKPYDPTGRLFFSLTHANGYAACAVSRQEVAIDLEFPRPEVLRAEKRIRTSEDVPEEFMKLWTAKECAMKYTGLGMSLSPTRIHVLEGRVRLGSGDISPLRYFDIPGGGTLAVLGGEGEAVPVWAKPDDFL